MAAVTDGIRSCATTPYVLMEVDRARAHTGVPSSKATYFLVRVGQGADVQQVRRDLQASLTDVEVLTPAEFRERSRQFWLFGTGAGAALFAGAVSLPSVSSSSARLRASAKSPASKTRTHWPCRTVTSWGGLSSCSQRLRARLNASPVSGAL